MRRIKRIAVCLLAAALTVCLFTPAVSAEEVYSPYYDPEDDRLTHLELLDQLCTGFPSVDYERFPEVPQYFQQDYPDVPYGGPGGKVSTHGCGITALCMLATYMTDTPLPPSVLAYTFARYSSAQGTEFRLFDESPGILGYYLEKRSYSWMEAIDALERGQMVISLQLEGRFTSTAHFIVLTEINEEGKIMVMDSNIYNHTSRFANTDYFENGFPVEIVIQDGSIYWIYEKKVVRVPGCSRCADPEAEVPTVPICVEEYYCRKCSRLLSIRNAYETAIDAVRVKPEI